MKLRAQFTRWIVAQAAVLAVVLGAPQSAFAGETEERAQALFFEGRELMAQERYAEACEKFQQSEALVSSGGTILNLGECNEKAGRLEEALPYFERAAELARKAGKTDIEAFALRRALEVRAKLDEQHRVQDGKTDPQAGEPNPAPPKRDPQNTGPQPDTPPQSTPDEPPSTQLWIGVGVGVAGAVGLIVGGAFGGLALSKNDEALAECNGDLCSPLGMKLTEEALDYAHISTGMLVGGGALAAVGLIVALTSPTLSSTSAARPFIFPWLDSNTIGATAAGRF